ncbi:MAG: FAD-binding domain-containing protein [Opitutales bacterium]
MSSFTPSRTAGLERLEAFLPRAGETYAKQRNYDNGPGNHDFVSSLSPWLRVRSISEQEVVESVLQHHCLSRAEKFIQEVIWRTYWKGWLQQRPSVWDEYEDTLDDLRSVWERRGEYQRAIEGSTRFNSFNTWARELRETGYLHNHARMWFASIWIHTLKLPWEMGAAFFLQHLLDGDCASNTLSWRWVAGIQTRGKAYSASADNIQKYTNGRLGAGERFAQVDLSDQVLVEHPDALELKELEIPRIEPNTCLIVTDDDVRSFELLEEIENLHCVLGLFPNDSYQRHGVSDRVKSFRKQSIQDSLESIALPESRKVYFELDAKMSAAMDFLKSREVTNVIVTEPYVGFWTSEFSELKATIEAQGIEVTSFRRPWDDWFFPHCKRGFFNLKKLIPKILKQRLRNT